MKDYGDILAQDVDLRIHPFTISTAALIALPPSERDPKMLIAILTTNGAALAIWRDDSTAVVDNLNVFVPTDIANGAAYIALPSSAPGRYIVIASDTGQASGIQKATVTVPFNNAALVASAVNGAAVSINIGAALPANARIAGVALPESAAFIGTGITAVTLDVGTAGDPIALVSGADVHSAPVDGFAATQPDGKAPHKLFATAGAQLLARFTPDASHALSALTAGGVTIDVLYWVLA